jgi:hypothetical protein
VRRKTAALQGGASAPLRLCVITNAFSVIENSDEPQKFSYDQ